jgi:hypothetical protein
MDIGVMEGAPDATVNTVAVSVPGVTPVLLVAGGA